MLHVYMKSYGSCLNHHTLKSCYDSPVSMVVEQSAGQVLELFFGKVLICTCIMFILAQLGKVRLEYVLTVAFIGLALFLLCIQLLIACKYSLVRN